MFKNLLVLFFLLPHLSYSLESVNSNVQLAYLSEQLETSLFLDNQNLSYIKFLKNCLCFEEGAPSNHPLCHDSPAYKNTLEESFINYYGDIKLREKSCEQETQQVRESISDSFPKMKRSLVLMKPEVNSDQAYFTETKHAFIDHQISIHPEHPVTNAINGFFVKVAQFPELSPSEIQRYLDIYHKESYKFCEKNFERELAEVIKYLRGFGLEDLTEISSQKICTLLIENKNLFEDSSVGENHTVEIASLIKDRFAHSYYQRAYHSMRRKFREKYRKDYLYYMNKNPYLLLVDSSNPSQEELIQATSTILENAMDRVSSLEDLKKSLEENLNGNVPFDVDDFDLSLMVGSYQHLTEVTESVMVNKMNYPAQEVKSVITEMEKELMSQNIEKVVTLVAAVVGANLACWLPWGRVVKATSAAMIRSGCLVTMSIPVNTYFFVDAHRRHFKSLMQFLSAPNGRNMIKKLNQVSLESRVATLTMFLLPVGLQVKEFSSLLSTAKQSLIRQGLL